MDPCEAACEFTRASGVPVPDRPQVMERADTARLACFVMEELHELLATTHADPAERARLLHELVDQTARPGLVQPSDRIRCMAEQADAMVDIWYFVLNAAAKAGVNLAPIFWRVHGANMAKADPVTQLFKRDANNKVVKPDGWAPPDVTIDIRTQRARGAWQSE